MSAPQLDNYCCQIDPEWHPSSQGAGPALPLFQEVSSYLEGFSDAAYPIAAIVDLKCSVQSFLVGPPLVNMSVEFVPWGGNYSAGIQQVRYHGPLMVEATLNASIQTGLNVRTLLNRALAITIVATPTTIAVYLVYGEEVGPGTVKSVRYRQHLWETFHPKLTLAEFQAAWSCMRNVQRWAKEAAGHLKFRFWNNAVATFVQQQPVP